MVERVTKVSLIAQVNSYVADFARANQSTKKLGETADETRARLEKQQHAMTQVGVAATAAGAVALAATGLAVKAAIDWESAWTGVTKTVNGTDAEMQQLEDDLRGLTRVLPATHEEIAAVAEAAGQLGVKRQDVAAFTKTMVDLSETTNLTADEAATSLAQLINVMGTAPDQVDNLGAALVALGNDGASTERDIVQMAQRIAGAGRIIGLSEGEVLGLANALSSVGIEVEAGGSAISNIMTDIAVAVSTGSDKLDQFASVAGLSSRDFQKAFKDDPADAIATFIEGLGRINTEGGDVFTTLSNLGQSDVRVSRALLGMANSGDLLRKSLELGNSALEDNTALLAEAEKRYATTEAKIQIAGNAVRDAAIDFGDIFLPIVGAVAEAVTDVANAFNDVPLPIQTAIAWIIALTGATALASGAFLIAVPRVAQFATSLAVLRASELPGVAAAATRVTGAVTKTGAALGATARFLTGPWGIAIVGAAIGVDLLSKALVGLRASAEEMDAAFTTVERSAESMYATTGKGRVELGLMGASLDQVQAAVDHLDGNDFNFFSFFTASDDVRLTADRLVDVGKQLGEIAKTDMSSATDSFQDFAERTDGSAESIFGLLQLMPDFKTQLIAAETEAGTYSETMTDVEKQSVLVAAATRQITPEAQSAAGAYQDAATEAGALVDEITKLMDAINEANGVGQDAVSANARYQESLAGISEEMQRQKDQFLEPQKKAYEELNGSLDGFVGDLSGFVATLDQSTASGSANAAMLADVAANAQASAQATYVQDKTTMSAKDATDKYVATLAAQRQAWIDSAVGAGFNRDEVTKLADAVFAVPDAHATQMLVETAEAQEKVGALAGQIQSLIDNYNNRTITLKTAIDRGASDAELAAIVGVGIPGRAGGGLIPGAPSRRDNRIYALATGEFVTNADATSRNRNALEYINRGGTIRGFAGGGEVQPRYASSPYGGSASRSSSAQRGPLVNIENITGAREEVLARLVTEELRWSLVSSGFEFDPGV